MPPIPLPALFLPDPANPELLTRLIKAMQCFFVKEYFPVPYQWRHPVAINVKPGMPPFGILANHKIKMCHNSMKKIMIQKITQNSWNFWTVGLNLIMRAKTLLTSCQIFRYAVPARTVTKKHWGYVSPIRRGTRFRFKFSCRIWGENNRIFL